MTAAGTTIGNYVLGPMLGRGGTSEVYAAEHRFLGEPAAIKLLRPHLADSDDLVNALVAEARRTRAIQHPNVVRVFDVGRDGDLVYLVIERIDGASLAERLHAGPLDEPTVRRLGAAIADGMAAAHELGIVHRDLKPANVMLAGDVPKVVDFGIARQLDKAIASGPRMGTPAYMAPEQIVGNVVAPSVDVWALGVLLYEAVTGALPFDTRDGALPQLVEDARPPACSPGLQRVILACLAREPSRRPPTMAAIASELRGDLDERVTQPVEDPPPAPLPASRRRRAWLPIAIGAGAAVIAIAAWQLASRAESPPAPAQTPIDAAVAHAPPVDAAAAAPVAVDPRELVDVEIRSRPAGALIVVDGSARGRTPATLALALPADIELLQRGFRVAHVRATTAARVDVRLVPLVVPPKPCPIPPCEGLD